LPSHAIKLSLPCSAFELVSLSVITQEYWVRTKTYLGIRHKQYHNTWWRIRARSRYLSQWSWFLWGLTASYSIARTLSCRSATWSFFVHVLSVVIDRCFVSSKSFWRTRTLSAFAKLYAALPIQFFATILGTSLYYLFR